MDISDAAYHTVHDYPGGPEALAPRMSMHAQILRNKVNLHSNSNHLNWRESLPLMEFTNDDRMLHALAKARGGVFVKLDGLSDVCDMAVLESVTTVWTANGTVGTEVHKALADGKVDGAEVKRIEQAIYDAQRSLLELVARLKGMAQK